MQVKATRTKSSSVILISFAKDQVKKPEDNIFLWLDDI